MLQALAKTVAVGAVLLAQGSHNFSQSLDIYRYQYI